MTPPAVAAEYLALGDSYTIGEGVPESGRWPMQLANALRADGIPMADPRIIAQTGWTTGELDAAEGPTVAVVVALIGISSSSPRPTRSGQPSTRAIGHRHGSRSGPESAIIATPGDHGGSSR